MAKNLPLLKYENIPCFWGFVNTLYYVSHLKQYVKSNKSKGGSEGQNYKAFEIQHKDKKQRDQKQTVSITTATSSRTLWLQFVLKLSAVRAQDQMRI